MVNFRSMMKIRIVLIAVFMIGVYNIQAQQERTKIDPVLDIYLKRNADIGQMVDLFVHGDASSIKAFTKTNGGIFKRSLNNISAIRIPTLAVRGLAELGSVDGFEFSMDPGRILNDSMRVNNHIVQVHSGGSPLPLAFTGEGVIVGVIDAGIELNHPDFQDANGNTRVMKLWDQNYPFDTQLTPAAYGYGQAWDSTMINAGQCPSEDQVAYFGHGSTVTGTATGNGMATGAYGGAAPDVDMIIVSNKLDASNWTSAIVDAVEWIFAEADALGKPCVINISLGTYYGSHDGLDAAALMIDDLITQSTGRAVVCAAGNSGSFAPYHLHTDVSSDTSFTWFKYITNSQLGFGAIWFDLWADTADFNNLKFAMGADKVTPDYSYRGRTEFFEVQNALNTNLRDTIWGSNGDMISPVLWYAQLRGEQYLMRVILEEPDSSAYMYRFMSTGSGAFDVWSLGLLGSSKMIVDIPSPGVFPDIVDYVLPDDEQRIVDSWACSPEVVTVANYHGEVDYIDINGDLQTIPGTVDDIASASSSGPTRDGRTKPDIAATGSVTLSCGPLDMLQDLILNSPFKVAPGGFHFRGGGTSIAAPVITGAIALYFEKCNEATNIEALNALLNAADGDSFTGVVPNDTWGAGKVNVFEALLTSNYSTAIIILGDTAICGDSLLVLGPPSMNEYIWSNGGTTEMNFITDPGEHSLITRNASGCIAFSDTIDFIQFPAPVIPVIDVIGFALTSSAANEYQWFYNGALITGETAQIHEATATGIYYVQTTDTNGCRAESDTVVVQFTGIHELNGANIGLYPNPARNEVYIEVGSSVDAITATLLDQRGRLVRSERYTNVQASAKLEFSLNGLSKGLYTLSLETLTEVLNLPVIIE